MLLALYPAAHKGRPTPLLSFSYPSFVLFFSPQTPLSLQTSYLGGGLLCSSSSHFLLKCLPLTVNDPHSADLSRWKGVGQQRRLVSPMPVSVIYLPVDKSAGSMAGRSTEGGEPQGSKTSTCSPAPEKSRATRILRSSALPFPGRRPSFVFAIGRNHVPEREEPQGLSFEG